MCGQVARWKIQTLNDFHLSGGAKGSVFYSKRYSANSGLNSPNLDFLPIQNIEDVDAVIDGVGAVPAGKFFLHG